MSPDKHTARIFVNLPVKDLPRAKAFFAKLGYAFNAQFTNDDAACMVVSDTIFAMLVTEPMFQGFTTKKIADAHKTAEVLLGLSCASRADVDKLVDTAIAAGGVAHKEPQDHGFMYSRAFTDLDGHVWDHFWMNPEHVQS